jgi:lysylphosphatidylglycerol synthetase-like protein (DUF2156 family)
MEASDDNVVIHHPNREKSSSKATKSIVIFLLIVSAVLVLIVTIGGWASLQGAQIVSIGYVIVFLVMGYFVNKWNRGVLPLAAALAILLLVVAAIAGPAWFERDKDGFDNPGIPPGLLGLLTLLIVPVQILLIAFAMRGFSQKWNVEIEMPREEYERRHGGRGSGGQPQYGGAAAG